MLDELYEMGLLRLGITGGEPFLRKDIFKIIKCGVDKGLMVGISTNGTLITPQVVKKLKEIDESGPIHLQVSFDGATPKTHDFIRGNSIFKKAISGLKMLRQEGLYVGIGFTPMFHNYTEVDSIIKFCLENDIPEVSFSFYVPIGRGTRELDFQPKQWEELLLSLLSFEKEYKNQIKISYHDPRILVENRLLGIGEVSSGFRGCQAGVMQCAINSIGDVYPCSMLPIKVFNIRQSTFHEEWETNLLLEKIRNRKNLSGKCGTCRYREICGGCRAVAYSYFGDPLARDPHCWIDKM